MEILNYVWMLMRHSIKLSQFIEYSLSIYYVAGIILSDGN